MLRRHLESASDFRDVLGKPVPLHGRDKGLVPGGLEGYVATAAARPGCVGVLVVLDSEGDCVAELGPCLLERSLVVSRVPVRVVLADACFEDWLFASAETLDLGLTYGAGINGSGAIKQAIRPASFTKPIWQPKLTVRMDLAVARARSASLERCFARFDELVALVP